MKRLLYILLPIIVILVGCNGSDTDKMLSSVDSLCMTNPDSALKIPDEIELFCAFMARFYGGN